jgi:hypothetical protein
MIQDLYDENGKNGKIKVGHRVGHRVGLGPGFVVTHKHVWISRFQKFLDLHMSATLLL